MVRGSAAASLSLLTIFASCDPAADDASKTAASTPPPTLEAEAPAAPPSEPTKAPPPKPPPATEAEPDPPPSVPAERPSERGLEVEHRCDLGHQHIELTVAMEIEQMSIADPHETLRVAFDVACVQCVREVELHEDCKPDSWICEQHTRFDLTDLDRGEPLRAGALSSGWHVQPIERPRELNKEIDWLLDHIDDPERYVHMRKTGELEELRALATRIQAQLSSLESSPVRRELKHDEERTSALLEIQGNYRGVLSIADGTVRMLSYQPVGYGEASCEGVHGPSPKADDVTEE